MNPARHQQICEEQFFYYLLKKTEEAFQKSKTKEINGGKNWNFAICDTPIQKGKGLFFGLNWGGSDINQQSAYPDKDKERNWGFISNSRKYFREYLSEEIEDLNYSNLCFFRSPSMKEFQYDDWELGLPLFQEYTEYVNPKWMLMLGNPPAILKQTGALFDLKRIVYQGKNKSTYGYTGKMFDKFIFGCVPHPQSRISREAREYLWAEVTSYIKDNT